MRNTGQWSLTVSNSALQSLQLVLYIRHVLLSPLGTTKLWEFWPGLSVKPTTFHYIPNTSGS